MSVFAVSFRHLDIDVLPDCRIEAQTIRGAKDGRGEGRKTRRKEGNGKLGGWIAGEAGREARLALGKWVIRRASASVIACKTLHTLRHCQLPKGSEISNFGNKDEDSEQSWATTGEQEGRTYFVQNRTRRTEGERERVRRQRRIPRNFGDPQSLRRRRQTSKRGDVPANGAIPHKEEASKFVDIL